MGYNYRYGSNKGNDEDERDHVNMSSSLVPITGPNWTVMPMKNMYVQYIVNKRYMLLLSGDVETNPGPALNQKCPCEGNVPNDKQVTCISCKQQWHLTCVGLNGITDKPFDTINKVWKCVLCLPLPDKIKSKLAASLKVNDQDKILNNLKEMEKRIVQKIDNKVAVEKFDEMEKNIIETIGNKINDNSTPFKDAIMTKLEKKVSEINKTVKTITKEEENTKNKLDLTRIIRKPNDMNIRNSKDLRKEFGKIFPNVQLVMARISAGGSFVLEFEKSEDAVEVEDNWDEEYFEGNSGIIKVTDKNRVGLVKFVYSDLDENEISESIEQNYPDCKYDLFMKDGEFTGMIKVEFKNEVELNIAIRDKFKIGYRKYITVPFEQKPRVIKCNICQLMGHISRRCRNKDKPRCGKCSQEGHETKDCETPENLHKCFYCGQKDHITGKYSCPKIKEKLQELKDRRDGQ